MRTDGNVEALVALRTQLGDGDVFADVHAAAKFHTHLPENFDFGIDNILFEAEARDAEHKHAAGNGVAVEHGHGVALFGQIIGASHAGRAGADDSDLLRERNAALIEHLWHVALVGVQLLLCDEFLDLVDGDCAVHAAAGAGLLAAAVADVTADGGEGVFFFDEPERIQIAALGCHADVALYGNVCRAVALAGSGSGVRLC